MTRNHSNVSLPKVHLSRYFSPRNPPYNTATIYLRNLILAFFKSYWLSKAFAPFIFLLFRSAISQLFFVFNKCQREKKSKEMCICCLLDALVHIKKAISDYLWISLTRAPQLSLCFEQLERETFTEWANTL